MMIVLIIVGLTYEWAESKDIQDQLFLSLRVHI